MGSSTSGSILHQNVANFSCLYLVVASESFGSCLNHAVVTSCPFLPCSCLFQEAVLLVVFVLVAFLLIPNAFLRVVRRVVCLFFVVVKKALILFQKLASSLTLIIADFILGDQLCPPLLRSEWYLASLFSKMADHVAFLQKLKVVLWKRKENHFSPRKD